MKLRFQRDDFKHYDLPSFNLFCLERVQKLCTPAFISRSVSFYKRENSQNQYFIYHVTNIYNTSGRKTEVLIFNKTHEHTNLLQSTSSKITSRYFSLKINVLCSAFNTVYIILDIHGLQRFRNARTM